MKRDRTRDEMNRMREAVAETLGERFCSSCNRHKKTAGGKFKFSRTRMWRCADCVARISKGMFK